MKKKIKKKAANMLFQFLELNSVVDLKYDSQLLFVHTIAFPSNR